MLAIRLKRVGRKNLAVFRVVVQDSHWSAKSGKFVAQLGSYNPHSKKLVIDKEKTEFYLKNGAQPSERIVLLLKKEGVKLPSWVPKPSKKQGKPKSKKEGGEQPAAAAPAAPANEAPATEEPAAEDKPEAQDSEASAEEAKPAEEPKTDSSTEASAKVEEKPAEEKPAENPKPEPAAEDKPAE